MPNKSDNKLVTDLNQIKSKQQDLLDRLDDIKQNADADVLPAIEKIESNAWAVILEIDELKKKINFDLTAQIERNTILSRMRKPARRERIGNVCI